MRVRDIVAEPLVVNGELSRREIEERVQAVPKEGGIRPELAESFPHEFSGGQRQRIAIAAALISEPELIVLAVQSRHLVDRVEEESIWL